AIVGDPQAVVFSDAAAPRPRVRNGRAVDGELAGLDVELADVRGGEIEQIEIVVVVGGNAIGRDGSVVARILERAEVLPLPSGWIEPQNLSAVRVLDPHLAIDLGIGWGEERLLGGVRLPLLRHLPGL